MKNIFIKARPFFAPIAMAVIATTTMPLVAQVDTDSATGIPQVMVVENVDSEAGTVTLNGNIYRVSVEKRPIRAAQSPNGRPLKLSDLEQGMEVLVSTDGTMPDDAHQPRIKGIWEPR